MTNIPCIGCGLLILVIGVSCFLYGWMACLSYHYTAKRMTITMENGKEEQIYLGPLQAIKEEILITREEREK